MTTTGPQPRRSVEDFHFGAKVVSADGRHIGSLNFMIIDGESFDIHAIVVKETRHFSGHEVAATALMEDDISIPVGAVKDVTRELITLSITSAEARRTEPYLTYQLAPPEKGDTVRRLMAQGAQTGYAPRLVEEAHKRLDEIAALVPAAPGAASQISNLKLQIPNSGSRIPHSGSRIAKGWKAKDFKREFNRIVKDDPRFKALK